MPHPMPPECHNQCLNTPMLLYTSTHTAICVDLVHAQGDEEAQYNLDLALNLGIGGLNHAHKSPKDKVKFVK